MKSKVHDVSGNSNPIKRFWQHLPQQKKGPLNLRTLKKPEFIEPQVPRMMESLSISKINNTPSDHM